MFGSYLHISACGGFIRSVSALKLILCVPCPDQVSGGELQHVWRKRGTKSRRSTEEEDRYRGHLHAVPQYWGEQPLPGFLFFPLPSLWKPHEQTQECHRTGELTCMNVIIDQLHVVLGKSWTSSWFPFCVSFADVSMNVFTHSKNSVLICPRFVVISMSGKSI